MRKVRVPSLLVTAVLMLAAAAGGAAGQKLTLAMRDFEYSPSRITLQAGVPAEITITNKGKVAHEFMLYDTPRQAQMTGGETGRKWVEKTNYFRGVEATVDGGKVNRTGGALVDVRVAVGNSATLRFTPLKKGTFEFGCMIEGHYEAGQKGVLVVK